jgi:cytochrome c
MRKVSVIALVIIASVVLVASTLAESATKEECVAKCKEAAQLITEKGMDAAFQELQKKDGKFVWKDSYVAVFDFTGTHLTHPLHPAAVGKNVIGFKDSNGKFVIKELIEVAKTKGGGMD